MYIHYEEVRQECRPLMDRIQSPVYRWAWARVREIEQYGKAVSVKDVFMSVLVISEPHYMRQLRPIVRPTINVTKDAGILEHIKYVLSQELTTSEI